MLSKEASSTIFWVFGMTRPGIEPRSPGPLANTLTPRLMSGVFHEVLVRLVFCKLVKSSCTWEHYWIAQRVHSILFSLSYSILLDDQYATFQIQLFSCPFGWVCRIHQLLLCRNVRPAHKECPEYDTKQSDGEVPVILELWGMQSTPSLPSLPGPLWPGVVATDRAPSMG